MQARIFNFFLCFFSFVSEKDMAFFLSLSLSLSFCFAISVV